MRKFCRKQEKKNAVNIVSDFGCQKENTMKVVILAGGVGTYLLFSGKGKREGA